MMETQMTTDDRKPVLERLAETAVEGVCIGQIAALAGLRAEMAALSTMMSGLPHARCSATGHTQVGARAIDPDPEDEGFDNMPV
jgi:hypothetical protein